MKLFRILALLEILEIDEPEEKTVRKLVVVDKDGERRVYKEY